ncbi:hypothetical protein AD954_00760 [Acetobacter cerevisiae]|uniref:Uncharacterized protein n=1 Tax=Acetobacter cerevisiae TaxID=178900 RepID=A0A149VFM0_9PROT|nr:hypothetical protein AD954_00760 [Acetobacter cerevisiae]
MPIGQRQFYVRRLKDPRLGAIDADFAQIGLPDYALLCGRTLARAFADAIASCSTAYADQTTADWRAFYVAIKALRIYARIAKSVKKYPKNF